MTPNREIQDWLAPILNNIVPKSKIKTRADWLVLHPNHMHLPDWMPNLFRLIYNNLQQEEAIKFIDNLDKILSKINFNELDKIKWRFMELKYLSFMEKIVKDPSVQKSDLMQDIINIAKTIISYCHARYQGICITQATVYDVEQEIASIFFPIVLNSLSDKGFSKFIIPLDKFFQSVMLMLKIHTHKIYDAERAAHILTANFVAKATFLLSANMYSYETDAAILLKLIMTAESKGAEE